MTNRVELIRMAHARAAADRELVAEMKGLERAPRVDREPAPESGPEREPVAECEHQRATGAPCSQCWQASTGAVVQRVRMGERGFANAAIHYISSNEGRRLRRARVAQIAAAANGGPAPTDNELRLSIVEVSRIANCPAADVVQELLTPRQRALLPRLGGNPQVVDEAKATPWLKKRLQETEETA